MTLYPNFLVIGAMKAGTTSLWKYLRSHPEVFMPDMKEPSFFVEEINWTRGLDWYGALFRLAEGKLAIGEASTAYTKHPRYRGAPERIARILAGVRLIYVVRHPIDRIHSHYVDEIAGARESRPIDQAVLSNPDYLDYSRYAMQLDRYLDHFPRDRLLIVQSERLRHQRARTLKQILRFLGVNEDWHAPVIEQEFRTADSRRQRVPAELALRRAPGASLVARILPSRARQRLRERLLTRPIPLDLNQEKISDDVRHQLQEALRPDVRRLRSYLPNDFDGWGIA